MTEKSRDFLAALAVLIVAALLLSLFSPVRLIRQGGDAGNGAYDIARAAGTAVSGRAG